MFNRKEKKDMAAKGFGARSLIKDIHAATGTPFNTMLEYSLGLFVLAYVGYEAIKAMVNTTGMTGTIGTILTVVLPILAAIIGIALLFGHRKK